ncbi:MAG: threonine dehydratase [Chthoniobacteraceae bacterium]
MNPPVSYSDVLDALPRVHAVLNPTLLREWPGLSELCGCELWLKHENHQPVGAFKVRGGINLVATLTPEERAVGIIGVSTGNHGQSLAFAAKHFGVRCTIIVPVGNNPDKNRAIRQLGAELIEHGRDFDEAREHVATIQRERGGRCVHSANEPKLIAGVGTMAWEIFEKLPEPDVILVPIGLGSGVCGTCIVAKHRRPRTKIIGVQSHNAPAVARSWQSGEWIEEPSAKTWAEGLATRVPAEMTLAIMREHMDDVILVSDDELRHAAALLLKHTHNLAEGAGAATLAAALQQREKLAGQKVVATFSGGNLDLTQLPAILSFL